MRRRMSRVHFVATVVVLTWPRLAAADVGQGLSTKINSELVGAWEIYPSNSAGSSHWVFEFWSDGTYTLHARRLLVVSGGLVFESKRNRTKCRPFSSRLRSVFPP